MAQTVTEVSQPRTVISNDVNPDYLFLANTNYWATLESKSIDENDNKHEPGGGGEVTPTAFTGLNELSCHCQTAT